MTAWRALPYLDPAPLTNCYRFYGAGENGRRRQGYDPDLVVASLITPVARAKAVFYMTKVHFFSVVKALFNRK